MNERKLSIVIGYREMAKLPTLSVDAGVSGIRTLAFPEGMEIISTGSACKLEKRLKRSPLESGAALSAA
jgi:hypothetical protein